jgi:hypothetical protein
MFPKFLCCPHTLKPAPSAIVASSIPLPATVSEFLGSEPGFLPQNFVLILSGPTLCWRKSKPTASANTSRSRFSLSTSFQRRFPSLLDYAPSIPRFYHRPSHRRRSLKKVDRQPQWV